jgi:hypothetical protein
VALGLTIGLNQIDPRAYGTTGKLNGPVRDAETMAAIARKSERFRQIITLNSESQTPPTLQATNANVLRHIAWAAAILQPGDLFLLTYSGHGSQMPTDPSGDETDDHKDETWCLDDGHLVDDILYHFWSRFADGVRIVVFADSCHSATSVKVAETLALAQANVLTLPANLRAPNEKKHIRALEQLKAATDVAEKSVRAKSLDLEKHHKAVLDQTESFPLIKALPVASGEKAFEQEKRVQDYRDLYPTALGDKTLSESVGVKGLLLAACADDRQALDGTPNSVFTEAVNIVLGAGSKLDQSYSDLFTNIGKLGINPSPQFFPFGQSDTSFHKERLFTLG